MKKAHQVEEEEIESLNERIRRQAPQSGSLIVNDQARKFDSFPISQLSLKGLVRAKFDVATEIQKQVLPHALLGRDVLGAARTGSGKTLAFLIPLVEDLYRSHWSSEDGVGGLIVTPTRELAVQIFEVLKVLINYHSFLGGILVGGAPFQLEQRLLPKLQILVVTPGRILQHLEQTPNFDISSSLRVLVLDETDRLFDMGFQEQLHALLEYIPKPRSEGGSRQTLLFSATQTKSIKDLARLSLKNPEYLSIQEDKQDMRTPVNLKQSYVCVDLSEKLNMMHSFIKSHLKSKTIIFFSSCNQVRFIEGVFRKMRPGVSLSALHGKLSQTKRIEVYDSFCSKQTAVLFATDIASRGLDFPDVDWVVQMDCPEDEKAYIHRVGRTARYKKNGNALLALLPSEEEPFTALLKSHGIEPKKLVVNKKKQENIQSKIQSILISDPTMKALAQKAFKGYLRSVHLQTNKDIFNLKNLGFREFAASLGLASTPRIRFVGKGGEQERERIRYLKNNRDYGEDDDSSADDKGGDERDEKRKGKWEKLRTRKANPVRLPSDDVDEQESFEPVRKSGNSGTVDVAPMSMQQGSTQLSRGTRRSQPEVINFDENANVEDPFQQIANDKMALIRNRDSFVSKVSQRLQEEDIVDKESHRKRVKELHRTKKEKKKLKVMEPEAREVSLAMDGLNSHEHLENAALDLIEGR